MAFKVGANMIRMQVYSSLLMHLQCANLALVIGASPSFGKPLSRRFTQH
jgi:hypothetical protein